MESEIKTAITVKTTVQAPIEIVWEYWTNPKHITNWCQASDDWNAPYAENNLKVDGRFKTTMAARDGSTSFDFEGTYNEVKPFEKIVYTLDDDRKVKIDFINRDNATEVIETFEAEDTFPVEMQKEGWQAILENFRKYVEAVQVKKNQES